jgi:hypothetical protein
VELDRAVAGRGRAAAGRSLKVNKPMERREQVGKERVASKPARRAQHNKRVAISRGKALQGSVVGE